MDFIQLFATSWKQVLNKVNKAVVFVDATLAECLHWSGGAAALFNAGAKAVREFSSFVAGAPDEKKAVFLVSGYILSTNEQILKDIIVSSHFEYVVVISDLPAAFHTMVCYNGHVEQEDRVFNQLEESIRIWMKNMNYSVEVTYLALSGVGICSDLFVLPGHQHTSALLPQQMNSDHTVETHSKGHSPKPDAAFSFVPTSQLTREVYLKFKTLVYNLNSVMEMLNVSEEIFSLGHTSNFVASELANISLARSRRKNAQRKVSLVLVDRSLDLPSCVSHQSDTLLDRVLMALPRLPGHHNDIRIDMSPLCHPGCVITDTALPPGCLAHNALPSARDLLGNMVTLKVKEGLMEVNRKLMEVMASEGIPPVRTARVTVDHLQTLLHTVSQKPHPLVHHSAVLQQCLGCVQALKSPRLTTVDRLLAVEKGLIQCAGCQEPGQAPVDQVIKLLDQQTHSRDYTITELLGLLVMAFSLSSDVDPFVVQNMKVHLVQLLTSCGWDELPPFIKDQCEGDTINNEVTNVVNDITNILLSILHIHDNLKYFKETFCQGGSVGQVTLKPLVKSLVQAMMEAKDEVPDLQYQSTGFRNLLKSSFSLFMNVNKPKPTEQQDIIIFVIGGVTSLEYKQVHDYLGSRSKVQVYLGGTHLTTPADSVQEIFSS